MSQKTIIRQVHGSHLYGLNTPSSDKDYKYVFVPDMYSLFTVGPYQHSNVSTKQGDGKNTADDVDMEGFSLAQFFRHAMNGEMIAFDMLFTPDNMILEKLPQWDLVRENRSLFFTKNMKAYSSYIKKQTSRYGTKGSRINAMKMVIDILEPFGDKRIHEVWDLLPVDGEFLFKQQLTSSQDKILPHYEVCGKRFVNTVKASDVLFSVKKGYEEYGKRAQLAAKNEGVDWKAVSHAIRACCQLQRLYRDGDFTYPLPENDVIMKVKLGQMDFNTQAAPLLEKLLQDVNALAAKSTYPEHVDGKRINDLLYSLTLELASK